MPTKYNPTVILAEADKIIDTWTANADFKLGDITLVTFKAGRTALAAADAAVESKKTELSGLMNDRDDQAFDLNEQATRARAGFKAVYGPDSSQYEQAGGTRASERKSPHRTAKPATT